MWLLLTTVLGMLPAPHRRGGNSEIVSRNPADFSDNSTTLVAESYIQGDFIYRPRALEVVQADSLKMDKLATLERLQQIHTQQRSLVAGSQLYPPKPWG